MSGARSDSESPSRVLLANVLLGLLVAGAFVIRFHRIDEPLLTFHPTRQYRSAMIARSCYYDVTPEVPEWSRRVARANRLMQPEGEPPVMEWLACAGYRLLGRETLEVPRVVAVTFWVLGAFPLYRLSLRLVSTESALAAVAVYLFLPYGIVASRSFQPDALMTTCSVWAVLLVIRNDEDPTTRRLVLAGLAIAVATLVKPMSIFFTLFALAGVSVARLGWKGASINPGLYALLGVGLLPATLYYGHAAVFGHFARDQMRTRFVPDLLRSSFFWRGWLTQIRGVFGLPVFTVALGAMPLARRGLPRSLQAGLWIGYVAFAIAFTYHMPTHDYYHLPFIAAAALGVGTCVDRLERFLIANIQPHAVRWSTVALALTVAATGSAMAWPRLNPPSMAETFHHYADIGDLANHDTRVVFLDPVYGYPVMYHGQVSGDAWPNIDDLAAESLSNEAPLEAETRFTRDYADFAPRYFIVTDLHSFDAQPDLQRLLDRRATLIRKTPEYRVYRFVP